MSRQRTMYYATEGDERIAFESKHAHPSAWSYAAEEAAQHYDEHSGGDGLRDGESIELSLFDRIDGEPLGRWRVRLFLTPAYLAEQIHENTDDEVVS